MGFKCEGDPLDLFVRKDVGEMSDNPEEPPTLVEELRALLNRHSAENESDTPDFILAEFLLGCLNAYDTAIRRRSDWYGRDAPAWRPRVMDDPFFGREDRPIAPWETQ